MRWTIVADVVIITAVWVAAFYAVRHGRKGVAADMPREVWAYQLQTIGVMCAVSGVTCFVVWLLSDSTGPRWLHVLSEPVALIAIALAVPFCGYAAWVRAR